MAILPINCALEAVRRVERIRQAHPSLPLIVIACEKTLQRELARSPALNTRLIRQSDSIVTLLAALRAALPPGEAKRRLGQAIERATGSCGQGRGVETAGVRALTGRQREVLRLAAQGWTSARIARELGLSRRTVDVHRSNLLRRLNVNSIAEAVAEAMRHGLIN